MLQQTQVNTVIDYFQRFIEAFPSLEHLACSDLERVLELWSGLGYYARARNLHACAQHLYFELKGQFPKTVPQWMALKGIGRSTAGAILAQSMGIFAPILDGNVKRVLCRFHCIEGWPGAPKVEKILWPIAQAYTPKARVGEYTQAIMDLGATVCTRRSPTCSTCPLHAKCQAGQQKSVENFPHSRPKKKKPNYRAYFLIYLDTHDHVLLIKRPARGIWGGLWCFLEQPVQDDDHQEDWPGTLIHKGTWDRHVFSHYNLDFQPVFLRVRSQAILTQGMSTPSKWYKINALSGLALPAPIKRIALQLPEMIQSGNMKNGQNSILSET